MVKVENKETLRLLTRRFMKMNRARNVIAVIAIMLTPFYSQVSLWGVYP